MVDKCRERESDEESEYEDMQILIEEVESNVDDQDQEKEVRCIAGLDSD